eukprot:1481405-Prymnesium_polylepis.1
MSSDLDQRIAREEDEARRARAKVDAACLKLTQLNAAPAAEPQSGDSSLLPACAAVTAPASEPRKNRPPLQLLLSQLGLSQVDLQC